MAWPHLSRLARWRAGSIRLRLRLLERLRLGRGDFAAPLRPAGDDLVISGFFSQNSGVGYAARLTLDAMRRAGVPFIAHEIDLGPGVLRRGASVLPGQGGVWFIHANAQETLALLLAHDPRQWRDRRRIAYWVWETPEAPPEWASIARYVHEIWTPSIFSANGLRACFTRAGASDLIARVRVVPHPVRSITAPVSRPSSPLTVMMMFDALSAVARKNPHGAIAAWFEAFPQPTSLARLVVKARNLTDRQRRALMSTIDARPDIELMEQELSAAEMETLAAQTDIVMSVHRSEGFGLVLAEAMAQGKCVLCTGWSGNMDFMDENSAVLVPFELVPIDDPGGIYHGSHWAEPDIAAAGRLLRGLVEDGDRRTQIGAEARVRALSLGEAWRPERLKARLSGEADQPAAAATASAVIPNSL
ncbi:glycosyltransferase [Caulobacter sp.]|uniref:glycosyltransferase n=1 Tax=Caulobacter sp. TaxID=78 RepID=UPI003BAF77FF